MHQFFQTPAGASVLSEVLGELRDIEVRVVELTEKHAAATARLGRTAIVATQSGIVDQLAIHTIGGVVTPGETILQIVPENDLLVRRHCADGVSVSDVATTFGVSRRCDVGQGRDHHRSCATVGRSHSSPEAPLLKAVDCSPIH